MSYSPPYRVLKLDLAIARTASREVEVGIPVGSITVQAIPLGVIVGIALGTNKDFITVKPDQAFESCPPMDQGIFITNPAAAGILELIVAFGDQALTVVSS